jgi:hypothetical protein
MQSPFRAPNAYQSLLEEIYRKGSRTWQQWKRDSNAWSLTNQTAYVAYNRQKAPRATRAKVRNAIRTKSSRTHPLSKGSDSCFLDETCTCFGQVIRQGKTSDYSSFLISIAIRSDLLSSDLLHPTRSSVSYAVKKKPALGISELNQRRVV